VTPDKAPSGASESNSSKRPSGEAGNRPGTAQSAARAGNAFGPASPDGLADQNPSKRPDGLYRVTTRYLCAGFVIEGGKVTGCAPILRKKLAYWMTVAERIA